MKVTAILLAAGKGKRFGRRQHKPLVKLCAKPVIVYSLEALNRHPLVKKIIVAANRANREAIEKFIRQGHFKKVSKVLLGGSRRQDSVLNALQALDEGAEIVLVHDAARPLINQALVTAVIRAAAAGGAAVPGVPVKGTIKRVVSKCFVKETLDRRELYEIQTPQGFKREIILRAYKMAAPKVTVTDDASMVEKLGIKVSVVPGSYRNIKITTPEDLVIAEAMTKSRKS